MRLRIGLTAGDPAGIGPEIIATALDSGELPPTAEYVTIGKPISCSLGQPSQETSQAAFDALEESATRALKGDLNAVVTGPIYKAGMYEIGFRFSGQTEFFADRTGVKNYAMLLTGGKLTVALVTTHIPLDAVARTLKQTEIVRVGLLLADFLRRRQILKPRIAVAGLNPHAGESGALGREEIEIIAPAITELNSQSSITHLRETTSRQANHQSPIFSGPFSPDTIFHQAVKGAWDGVLCMYHDQGLIPLKLHAFDQGVNVTLGLPFPRTSPDHGTAFELAGKNVANPGSMIAAIRLAVALAQQSSENR